MATIHIVTECRNLRLSPLFALALLGPWKAVLLLFLTSSGFPMGTMVGELPERFTSKSSCQEFTSKMGVDPTGSKLKINGRPAEVVGHRFVCIASDEGQGV